MEIENVWARLRLLREVSAQQQSAYLPLVQDAVQRMEAKRAQPGGDNLLEAAAAALVNWQLSLTEPDGGFTAGDVCFEGGHAQDSAHKIWRDAFAAAAPFLHDEAFVFRRIP